MHSFYNKILRFEVLRLGTYKILKGGVAGSAQAPTPPHSFVHVGFSSGPLSQVSSGPPAATAGSFAPALAATIECKVATQSCHVTRWPQIGAVNLHSGSDWPVVFRIKLTNGTHPLDPWLDFWGPLPTFSYGCLVFVCCFLVFVFCLFLRVFAFCLRYLVFASVFCSFRPWYMMPPRSQKVEQKPTLSLST